MLVLVVWEKQLLPGCVLLHPEEDSWTDEPRRRHSDCSVVEIGDSGGHWVRIDGCEAEIVLWSWVQRVSDATDNWARDLNRRQYRGFIFLLRQLRARNFEAIRVAICVCGRREVKKMAVATSPESISEPSFWRILAQKAKSVLLEDGSASVHESLSNHSGQKAAAVTQTAPPGREVNMGRPLQKSLDAIASSLSLLGDTLGTAIEEGFHLMDGKSSIIRTGEPEQSKSFQRSSAMWKKVENFRTSPQVMNAEEDGAPGNVQLKASRDVAMAMASKAKLLLRELKILKADQAYLKSRCAELEEENRLLREGANQGDDLVSLQLESLLAEKQRLAQENANYARENQLLHEVVEYHHLTLQDVTLLDEKLKGAAETFSIDPIDQA